MTNLYTVWTVPKGYRVVKFDFLLNVQAVYFISYKLVCDCGNRQCRHGKIVNKFAIANRTNKGFFYCYDEDRWELPVTDAYQRARKMRTTA